MSLITRGPKGYGMLAKQVGCFLDSLRYILRGALKGMRALDSFGNKFLHSYIPISHLDRFLLRDVQQHVLHVAYPILGKIVKTRVSMLFNDGIDVRFKEVMIFGLWT